MGSPQAWMRKGLPSGGRCNQMERAALDQRPMESLRKEMRQHGGNGRDPISYPGNLPKVASTKRMLNDLGTWLAVGSSRGG